MLTRRRKTVATLLFTGADVRRLRKLAGLTQKSLAERSGVSQSLIARIEAGTVDPRLSTLNKILTALRAFPKEKTAAEVMHSPVYYAYEDETVQKAVWLMERHGISQLPILNREEKLMGSIREVTLIKMLLSVEPKKLFHTQLKKVVEEGFPTVTPSSSLNEVLALLAKDHPAVLVVDRGKLSGIITKIDVITSITKSG